MFFLLLLSFVKSELDFHLNLEAHLKYLLLTFPFSARGNFKLEMNNLSVTFLKLDTVWDFIGLF